MDNRKTKHLDMDARRVIEDGLREGLSAREIARRIGVNPTSVTREIKANRTVRVSKRKRPTAVIRCDNFSDCKHIRNVCSTCSAPLRVKGCRRCTTVLCTTLCPDFKLHMCEKTQVWPYVCECPSKQRDHCSFPKCRYSATEAHEHAIARRSVPRKGISLTPEELQDMVRIIKPLVYKGQSFEAIWATHGKDFPVGVRTFYNYVEEGIVDIASLDLPRKVRYKKRKRRTEVKESRIDRTGRLYEDFLRLPEDVRLSAVQMDTVCGFKTNKRRILSLQFRRFSFQLYLLLKSPEPENVVGALDALEITCGSREVFERFFGILLADRGGEFDDYPGMERSTLEPGKKRCKVYYCNPMSPNQKPHCERNHEELRRILPKGRSDFDKLDNWDVAEVCSHVNSYPRPALGGLSPYALASQVLPKCMLDDFGIKHVAPDAVTLKPTLVAHVVKQ